MARADDHVTWLVNTVPARSQEDFSPYHWITNAEGKRELRKGVPPAAVVDATNQMAEGKITLNDYLDMIGVPKS